MGEDRIFLEDEFGPINGINLTKETAKQLYKLLSNQFISYDEYPLVISLVKILREQCEDN